MAPEQHELIMLRIDDLKGSVDKMFDRCDKHMTASTDRAIKTEGRLRTLETQLVIWSGGIGFLAGVAVQLGMRLIGAK